MVDTDSEGGMAEPVVARESGWFSRLKGGYIHRQLELANVGWVQQLKRNIGVASLAGLASHTKTKES